MKICFIFAPYKHKKFEEDIDIVSRKFGIFPPLGIAYAAAIAQKHGHTAEIIDARALNLTKEQTLSRVKEFKPHVLGFLLTAYMFHDTLNWIEFFKEKTGLPVIVGNVLMELYPKEVMSYKAIDYGIIGPAQKSLPALLSSLEKRADIKNIKGLCYRNGEDIFVNPPETITEDFENLPFPARQLLPNEKYHAVMSKRKNVTALITSRGCPFSCSFCHIKGLAYSCRSPKMVVEEIQECYEEYNIREIEIFDPTFNVDRERVKDICQRIIDKKIDVDWACRARVDNMDTDILKIMKRAGCKRILYGIESGNQQILNRVNKDITLQKIESTISATRQAGIKSLGFFLMGSPGETVQTMKQTIRFAKDLKLDYAQFHKTMPKPHTLLYEQVKKHLNRDLWKEYIEGSFKECRFPATWTDLPQRTIENYTIKAYRSFYFRPGYLFRTLINIKSFDEFKRYLESFFGLLFARKDTP